MTVAEIKEYAKTIATYMQNYREVCREENKDEELIPTTPVQNDIEHLVSMLDQLDEWVSVDDRLPDEKGKCYLVTLEFRKDGKWQLQKEETLKHLSINRLLFLRSGKWDVWSDNMRVIAWKPLPKPYERKE